MSSNVTLLNNRPDLHAAPYLDEDRRVLTVQEIDAVNEYMDNLESLLRSCDAALEAVGGELEAALRRGAHNTGQSQDRRGEDG